MSIVGAFMVPHPPIIIPEVGKGEEKKISITAASYAETARRIRDLKPDTIIVSSPHSIMYSDYFHISPGKSAKGSFTSFHASQVKFRIDYDAELVSMITSIARSRNFPAGMIGERDSALDHGTMVPMYFINQEYTDYKLVRIGLSGLPLAENYCMGQIVRNAVEKLGRRAVFIGSGDLSHKCSSEGPYGYDDDGPEYDKKIMETMGNGSFGELLDYDENFCNRAAECGHRSFCMMAGALDGMEVEAEVLSHEDTFGVGYGICCYKILGANENRRFLEIKEKLEIQKCIEKYDSSDEYVHLAKLAMDTYIIAGKKLELDIKKASLSEGRYYFSENEIEGRLPKGLPEEMFTRRAGTFVSIHKLGQLRGCIGTISSTTDCIADEIIRNAVAASTKDPRFDPVRPNEIPFLEVSVDVLGKTEEVTSVGKLDVKKYGVIVTKGFKRGLLLPNLDGVDTVEEQIKIAMRKAGISSREGIKLERFEVVRHE